jgi:O-methyltransferase
LHRQDEGDRAVPFIARAIAKAKLAYDVIAVTPTARAVRKERLTYLGPEKMRRLEDSVRAVLRAGVPGDILEFGVALGGSAIVLSKQALRHRREFHGFDVFGMIPPPGENDDDGVRRRYQVIASGQSKGIGGDSYYGYRDDLIGDVARAYARHGMTVDGRSIHLHKGLFQQTWPEYKGSSIAFAHIDCDWYDPVRFCLQHVEQRLSRGGIMILDDYHDYGSCKRAVDEFMACHSDFAFADGKNVILRRR